jgi:aminoglycoside phosphotransferase (APT) family kinase protein
MKTRAKPINALHERRDTEAVTKAWESALQASEWSHDPVWFHGDVLPGNLLFRNEKLSVVIDFGGLGVGDPACDLMIAWNLLDIKSREEFRLALGVDDATWARGRGHALSQALIPIGDTYPAACGGIRGSGLAPRFIPLI